MTPGVDTLSARTLILLRHAKSDWPVGVEDISRPLAARGRRDAQSAADCISGEAGLPDLIITSPAMRTRETVEIITGIWPSVPDILVDDRMYDAEVGDVESVVAQIPVGARTVLLVGHNPGLADFAASWPQRAEPQAQERLAVKFPTSAMAFIDVMGEWSAPDSTTLRRVEVARGEQRSV